MGIINFFYFWADKEKNETCRASEKRFSTLFIMEEKATILIHAALDQMAPFMKALQILKVKKTIRENFNESWIHQKFFNAIF